MSEFICNLKTYIDDVHAGLKAGEPRARDYACDAVIWLHHALKRGTVALVPVKEGNISMTGIVWAALNDDDDEDSERGMSAFSRAMRG